MTNLKNFTVIASGKMRDVAYEKLNETVNLLGWQKGGRVPAVGSRRVGHDWATSLSLFTFIHWRRRWQATPVFLSGESQGQGSLVGCRLWGRAKSDTTE